jgi:hypothetical protein
MARAGSADCGGAETPRFRHDAALGAFSDVNLDYAPEGLVCDIHLHLAQVERGPSRLDGS